MLALLGTALAAGAALAGACPLAADWAANEPATARTITKPTKRRISSFLTVLPPKVNQHLRRLCSHLVEPFFALSEGTRTARRGDCLPGEPGDFTEWSTKATHLVFAILQGDDRKSTRLNSSH